MYSFYCLTLNSVECSLAEYAVGSCPPAHPLPVSSAWLFCSIFAQVFTLIHILPISLST